MKRIFAVLVTLFFAAPAVGQQGAWAYKNITTDTTTVLKSTPGFLHSVCVNTQANTGTVTVYDNTAASGIKIATITSVTGQGQCFVYNVAFWSGLTIVTATATPDVTVSFQ